MQLSHLMKGLAALILMPALVYAQPPGGGGPGGGGGGGGWRQRGGWGGGGRGGWDPAQMFDRFANGKEVWVRAESPNEFSQGFFDRIAQSMNITNGQITRQQFVTYMQQQQQNGWGGMRGGRGMRQGQGGPPGAPSGNGAAPAPGNGPGNGGNGADQWAENMFRRLDANGDGLLNYDEMTDALRAERDKWDENKDGFIDLTEFKKYFQAQVQQRMAENGGWNPNWQGGGIPDIGSTPTPEEEEIKKPVVYHAGNLPKDIPDWFKQIDSDGDGQIGLYEWKSSGRSLEEFRKIDRNNDGFLTIDEVMRYVGEQKKGTGSVGNGVAARGPGGAPGFGGRQGFGGFPGRGNGNRDRGDRSGG
jgi:Ca2+-binding EF-hand superfamily protein